MAAAATTFLPPETCLFSDVLHVWGESAELVKQFDNFPTFEDKMRAARKMPVFDRAWCTTHQRFCPIGGCGRPRPRIQSPPCPDSSQAGKKRGRQGPTIPATLAGGQKCAVSRAPCVVVENVPGFPDELAVEIYGSSWASSSLLVRGLTRVPKLLTHVACKHSCLTLRASWPFVVLQEIPGWCEYADRACHPQPADGAGRGSLTAAKRFFLEAWAAGLRVVLPLREMSAEFGLHCCVVLLRPSAVLVSDLQEVASDTALLLNSDPNARLSPWKPGLKASFCEPTNMFVCGRFQILATVANGMT